MSVGEQLNIRVRQGWTKRINAAAAEADKSKGEWLRSIIRRALEAAERRQKG